MRFKFILIIGTIVYCFSCKERENKIIREITRETNLDTGSFTDKQRNTVYVLIDKMLNAKKNAWRLKGVNHIANKTRDSILLYTEFHGLTLNQVENVDSLILVAESLRLEMQEKIKKATSEDVKVHGEIVFIAGWDISRSSVTYANMHVASRQVNWDEYRGDTSCIPFLRVVADRFDGCEISFENYDLKKFIPNFNVKVPASLMISSADSLRRLGFELFTTVNELNESKKEQLRQIKVCFYTPDSTIQFSNTYPIVL